MPALEIIAFVAESLVALLAVWAMLLPIVACFSGWRRLAEQFTAQPGTRGRILLGRDAQVPLIFYSSEARELVEPFLGAPGAP